MVRSLAKYPVRHVLVVGAGIGGLSAALALQRHGVRASLYERARAATEFGAGVVMTPNAIQGLNFLGVGDQVTESSSRSRGHEYRHYRTGEVLQRRPPAEVYTARYGAGVYYVHRADLHRALLAAVLANDPDCVHCGHVFTDLSQDQDGVVVRFANGACAKADALIGADGCRSVVREALHGREPVGYTGQVAFRALVPSTRLPNGYDYRRSMHLGPGRLFLSYPLRKNAFMNVVAIARQPAWQEESWTVHASVPELLERYADFNGEVRDLIKTIETTTLFKWGLHDRPPLATWSAGRATLLGDAAHPMSPFLGQGAALAIEDGVVLARCVAGACDLPQALASYERARRARADAAQRQSLARGDALQRAFVDSFDAHRDAEDTRLLDTFFDYNPATVALDEIRA
ncbi:MAG TPA: FAD-dependent monooxygenase [Bradyrhizobium sp.]|uniref:FAD-dependent monooxygenase n=1 Tax=Bradyrhizobium sp. TaxID=376 RepID=UPI002B491A27|nr:FAD-dependent monooxygenase [Bradyrhizobium sp.]HKO72995.1 FAD-dependent monooxygenase [Bradyrhizobium sp.]